MRNPVKSSNVVAIGYDKENKILEVEFKSGGVYAYRTVEESVYNDLVAAESIGKFFLREIKGNYPYTKLN